MKRCPDCSSKLIAFPVPPRTVVVRDTITGLPGLMSIDSGQFLTMDDVDFVTGQCVECKAAVIA